MFIVVQNKEGRLPSPSCGMRSNTDLLKKTFSDLLAEMGRCGGEIAKRLFRVHLFCALREDFFGLHVIWIRHAAVNRAYRRTLFLVEVSDTFRAFFRYDVVEVVRDGIMHPVQFPLYTAGVDRRVGALRFARSTIDAFFRDHCCHVSILLDYEPGFEVFATRVY
jgi:hypothetical protein